MRDHVSVFVLLEMGPWKVTTNTKANFSIFLAPEIWGSRGFSISAP